ncbi:MAG: hypothetical protein Q8R18_01245 [bacterium]|nr:hypothetical protein [bacterium]
MKKKATMRSSGDNSRKGNSLLWGLLILVLKVFGIAFLVQGFILQLATGILYYGLLHYTIGAILGILAWHLHKRKCMACK